MFTYTTDRDVNISSCKLNRTYRLSELLWSLNHYGPIVLFSLVYMTGILQVAGSISRRLFSTMAGEYKAGTHSMAFVTVPSEEVAKKLASGLVKNKLAACVNIIPGIKSIYEWEDKIEEDSELILMIKTRTTRVDDVSKFVRENHPNDVAEVISSPIENGNPPYLKWIGDIVPEK